MVAAVGALPQNALAAYRSMQNLADGAGSIATAAPAGGGFGDALAGALEQAMRAGVDQSNAAEAQSKAAIAGHGNLLDVVTAVSKAELSLQTTVAVRDRVVQAYQDIMHMAI